MTAVFPPIELHQLPKAQVNEFRRLTDKIVCAATVHGNGQDLILRVYLAGLYHGTLAANGWKEPTP
jgi:hypothetical protein